MKNYKKGFVIPLVIAIVALLGIGGGTYVYVNNKSAEKIENSLKEIAKNKIIDDSVNIQPQQAASSNIRTSGSGGKDGLMQTKENSSVTIISPNGGETFIAGDKMLIKWQTKNVASSSGVWFHLDTINGKHLDNGDMVSSWSEVLNTGEKAIIIPAGIPEGQYKLSITISMELEDVSDNFFTIKSNVNNMIITKAEAESLVIKTWGGCTPDTCSSVSVTVTNNDKENIVTAIYEGLRDDSSSSQKKVAPAYFNKIWTLGEAVVTQTCQPGRGQQEFSSDLCF